MEPVGSHVAVVVVDDDEQVLNLQLEALEQIGLGAQPFTDPISALRFIQSNTVELVITDWNMPGMTGMDLLFKTRALPNPPHVIIMTAYGTIDRAVAAMNEGAFNFLEKPFKLKNYQEMVHRALTVHRTQLLPGQTKGGLKTRQPDDTRPVAVAPAMRAVIEKAQHAAESDSAVLLLGESGTGKEVIADYIHNHSRRKDGPLIKVNCGALPENLMESELFGHEKGSFTGAIGRKTGRFEQASGGTLFLDEIGDLLLPLQVKLLRALQERTIERVGSSQSVRVDFRLICATLRDLNAAIAEKTFREDLFYRINVIPIRIPALRQRPEDVEPLIRYLFNKIKTTLQSGPKDFSEEALQVLKSYHWPGNVRQLRNAIEYALVLCKGEYIGVQDLPEDIRASIKGESVQEQVAASVSQPNQPSSQAGEKKDGLKQSVEQAEEQAIRVSLARHHWRMTSVAKDLSISRSTLYHRMRKYGINRPN